jgi:hypothetical protein
MFLVNIIIINDTLEEKSIWGAEVEKVNEYICI